MESVFITPKQAAELTGYSMSRIYKAMHTGEFKYKRPHGGKAFILRSTILKWAGISDLIAEEEQEQAA